MIAIFGRIFLFAVLIYAVFKILFGGSKKKTKPENVIEELIRDPVCGIFFHPSQAVSRRIKGKTYFFCSAECRDRFVLPEQ